MIRRAWLAYSALWATSILIAGCAPLTLGRVEKNPKNRVWSGRLSLSLASEPAQFFAASFELQGAAEAGELTLISPLGSTLAVMQWTSSQAILRQGQDTQQFDSMETLTRQISGAALPIHALFDWLDGIQTRSDGWSADLSRLEQGRLLATRITPRPAAELRLILDQ